MITAVSFRSLLRHRTRTLLALAGIAVSAALLLDMTMLASGLTDSFEDLIGARGYTLRVAPRGTLPFDSEAGIDNAAGIARGIAGIRGVRSIAPVLGAQLYRVEGDTLLEAVFAAGIDPEAQILYIRTEGSDPAAGEVVISRALAAAGALLPGDSLTLAAEPAVSLGGSRATRTYRISGIGDFVYASAGQRSVALPLAEVQALTGRPDEVSFFAVAAGPGVDEDLLARRISRAVPEVSAYSTRELVEETNRRLLYFRQLAAILGTIALVVTALLVSTIVTIGVRERWGEIATLRAIGVARSRLLLETATEGLVLAAAGCVAGLPLGLWMAERLDRILGAFPGAPARLSFFVWDAERVAMALALVLAAAVLAGLAPGWTAIRAPLAQVLREEAE